MSALNRRDGDGGPRHYLDDRPVHCGSFLELLVGEDTGKPMWLPVRYEASIDRFGKLNATLHVYFGIIHPRYSYATLRWPQKGGA